MRITKWGEYGILCTIFLAKMMEEEVSVTAQDIAKTQSIPLQYTHQILQRLRKGEIVESVRGPKGGYKLSRIPSEINLRQVLEASEGTTFEVICDSSPPYGDKCGQEHHCALGDDGSEVANVLQVRELERLQHQVKALRQAAATVHLPSLNAHPEPGFPLQRGIHHGSGFGTVSEPA